MKQQGFSLIELMITVALIALLALMGTSLSGGWVKSADRLEAEGDLTQALGRAQAAALRNAMGASGNTAVAAVCLSNTNVLTVLEGIPPVTTSTPAVAAIPPNCATPTGKQLWQTQVDTDVVITHNTTAFTCGCFNNTGLFTTTGCTGCITTPTFELTTGGSNEVVALY